MLRFVRVWLPAIVTVGGILVIVIGRNDDALEGGAGIIGAGLAIALLNLLHRIGVSGDRERSAEDDARDFYDRHGRWPDEPARFTPGPPPPAPAAAPEDTPAAGTRRAPGHVRPPLRTGPRRRRG